MEETYEYMVQYMSLAEKSGRSHPQIGYADDNVSKPLRFVGATQCAHREMHSPLSSVLCIPPWRGGANFCPVPILIFGLGSCFCSWYHSHPGYRCWLSRTDCGTQKLYQDHQDPSCAIVVRSVHLSCHGTVWELIE